MDPNILPYLWGGLDLERYEPIRAIVFDEKHRDVVILMYGKGDKRSPQHWCLEYRGGGKYFRDFDSLSRYYRKRFKKKPRRVI